MKSQQLQRYSHGTSAEDRDEIIHMKYLCIVTTLNQRNHETSTAADRYESSFMKPFQQNYETSCCMNRNIKKNSSNACIHT